MEQHDFLRHLINVLDRAQIEYCIVGSQASMTYGETRHTEDIDVVCNLQASQIGLLLAGFPPPRFTLSEDAIRMAIRDRFQFNILDHDTGYKADMILTGPSLWSRQQLKRRRSVALLEDLQGYLSSPEDVIIGKLIYYTEGGSEKHLRDITGMLRMKAVPIDTADIDKWATVLNVTNAWNAVKLRLAATPSLFD